MGTTGTTTPQVFQKATLENPDSSTRRDPSSGLLFSPERVTDIVGSATYERCIAEGWEVLEVWTVWLCSFCGMADSDREHADWEFWCFGDLSHLGRYGHESVRPEAVPT